MKQLVRLALEYPPDAGFWRVYKARLIVSATVALVVALVIAACLVVVGALT